MGAIPIKNSTKERFRLELNDGEKYDSLLNRLLDDVIKFQFENEELKSKIKKMEKNG